MTLLIGVVVSVVVCNMQNMSGLNLQAVQALLDARNLAPKPHLEFKAGLLNVNGDRSS